MMTVLQEQQALRHKRTKRAQSRTSTSVEGKTTAQLAKELNVSTRTVQQAIVDLWGTHDSAELTEADVCQLACDVERIGRTAKVPCVEKVLPAVDKRLVCSAQKNCAEKTILSNSAQKNCAEKTILSNSAQKNCASDYFKFPAPQVVARTVGGFEYAITAEQETLIRCLLVPKRVETVQHVARLTAMVRVLLDVAAEQKIRADRLDFVLDLQECGTQAALHDDLTAKVQELEAQVASLKAKLVDKHEALCREQGKVELLKEMLDDKENA